MSGYDKRVRVGVDADAAVDRAIEKLLELKNTADELDGKKSTITAELKTNTSALDKLQKTTVKIPAIIEATGKSSLSASTKKAITAQAKQVESIINKAVKSGYDASFQTLPANLYRLNANEIKGVRDGMPKTLAVDSDEYKALYRKRYEYSRATKWALAQQENAQPLNTADFTDMAAYIQAVKAQEKLLVTYTQNQKNIKALFGEMKDSIPENSHITRPGNKDLIGIGKTLESSVEDSKSYIASAFDLDSLQAAIESGSEDMVQAAISNMQNGINTIATETSKATQKIKADKAFNTTGNKSLSSARDKMLKNISSVTADEASSILKKDFEKVLSGDKSIYDFSTTMLAKLFRNFVVYKNKGGTGLSGEQLKNLDTAIQTLSDDPENGKFWSEAYPRLEEAIRNPVVETPAIQSNQTSKKSTHSKKSPTAQAKKAEKAADTINTATDHINNVVASTVGNTTENMDKMADSAERLGIAVQDTTRIQEDATKQEKLAYKVSRGPRLKAIPATPVASNSSKNSNIPTFPTTPPTSGNPTLPSVPGTPNFDDMQLLAEKTASNGQKITKVYKDVNRKVHTLTQTYSQANNTWSATIGTGIKFETLEQDSAKTTAALVSNRQKLYAEMTKPQSQRDSGKIANLKSEIQRLQIQQQEHDSVSRAYDQDPTSDYSMTQYRQQVAERMKPNWAKLRDQNNIAVNANKKAYQEEREATQKQKTQSIVGQYTTAVKQAQKLNQVNKEILDIQKQLNDKSNTGIDRTKLQSNLRDLKDQKASLEKTANAFKISDFISKNKTLLESQGKDIDEFDEAMRKAEKSNASLRNYSQNKISDQIISQYEDLMSGLSELEKKNKELSSAKSKGTSNDLINNIRKEIDQKQKSLGDIDEFIEKNKGILGEDRINAFNTQKSKLGQAEQNVYDAFQQDVLKQKTADFTSQYDSAIGKVRELKQAYVDLYNIQSGGANGKYSKDELTEKISAQRDTIKALQQDVGNFYSSVYKNNQSNKNSIFDTKKFDEYERALDDMFTYSQYNGKNNNIIELMKKAYSNKRNAENKMLSLSGKSNVSGDIAIQKLLAENYDTAYESLRGQVKSIFGKDVAEKAISGIRDHYDLKQDQFVSNGTESFIKQIDTFVSTLKKAGYATSDVKSQFNDIKSSVLDIQSTFNQNRNAKGINDYVEAMQQQLQLFDATKEYYQSGKGSVDLPFNQIHERLTKYAKTSEATSDYVARVNEFTESYNKLTDTFNASSKGKKDIEEYKAGMDELVNSMKKFEKTSDGLNKTTSKGTMIENTAHQIKDTADASKALTDYAASIGLTNKISQSVNDATGKVTMNFETASGDVVKLTGNIEKANDSLRVMYQNTTKTSTGFSSFSQGLKGLVSGNFKGAIGDIASYVGNIQIMYKAINEMKQGFNTFMDYNKALTTVSYTMDMSQSQLQNLGSSAVDMAKDLSMSLDNTMDIYQIYANMNTTSQEIQETAKPTAILSNLSSVDASTAADQVQGILQQFHMLEDGSTSAADASMHVVDVLDKISANVGMDYAKGIKVMTDAVQASGQVAYDAGMSYEQLAAISAKVAERTREDGSSIGNAIKTIITRTTKVGKMPQYSDEVSNEDLSNASASLHAVGVDVYNPDGSDRGIITVLSELKSKWNDLTDAQQAKIAFDVAA